MNEIEVQEIVNMDALCEIINSRGVPCFVDMTGGGTATMYLGENNADYYTVIVGPGYYAHIDYDGTSVALWDELSYGRDDDGETEHHFVQGECSIEHFADELIGFYNSVKAGE